MGTSLACVQVYLGDRERKAARRSIVKALRKRVLAGPYVETSRGTDPDPDREVFVGALGEAPWLTVYDTQGDLHGLARDVSAAVKGTAVFAEVIDSDVVHLRRYSRGEMVDDYCSAPDVYEIYGRETDWPAVGEEELKALTRGDLAKWRDLLVEGADVGRLREVWDSDPIFAEDVLWATADALAMDGEELDAAPGVQGGTRLTFRLEARARQELKAEGPPRLGLGGGSDPRAALYPGQALHLQVYLQSEGGAAVGMVAFAWGSAVEQGIVTLDRCVAIPGVDPDERVEAAFAPEVATVGKAQREVLVARFEALELPQGVPGGVQVYSQPGVSWERAERALRLSRVTVELQTTVSGAGAGELYVGLAPLDNPLDGQAVYHATLRSVPLPRRPLRCPKAQHAQRVELLRQLEQPAQLFALVALGAGREASAEVAADAVEAWVAQVTREKTDGLQADLGTWPGLQPNPGAWPGLQRRRLYFSAGEIPADERWQEVRQQLAGGASLAMQHKGASALYEPGAYALRTGARAPAPQLGFWFDTAAWEAAELDAVAAWLAGLVDRLMAAGAGLQAMIGRWQWRNAQSMAGTLGVTPYERACGVHGSHSMLRGWCSRYLRGVTGQLWLGRELLDRLGGTAGLARIAAVRPVGEGVRAVLSESATLDELEEALAPLLPGEEDEREAARRLCLQE